jgi:DNA polymerase-3 subunit alpha
LTGYYLSSHPYLDVASSVHASHTIQSAREEQDQAYITVGGIVSRLTEHTTKKSKQKMAFGAIEDDKAVLEFVIFPYQYEKVKNMLKLDAPLILAGKMENSGDDSETTQSKLIVSSIEPIARGIKKVSMGIEAIITLPRTGYRQILKDLREQVDCKTGIADVKLRLPNGKEVKFIA